MPVLSVLRYPDPKLRIKTDPVVRFSAEIRQIAEDLAETMYEASGVGLAATQVGIPTRMFVVDVAHDENRTDLRVFVNPQIIYRAGRQTRVEGCLSFPGIVESLERDDTIIVRAQDVAGKAFEVGASGLLSVAIQHELDHLDGRLFIDLMSPLKRRITLKKMSRLR